LTPARQGKVSGASRIVNELYDKKIAFVRVIDATRIARFAPSFPCGGVLKGASNEAINEYGIVVQY
jgi:hypothetical protein